MTESIKTHITTSYMVFINSFGDPSSINKKELEEKGDCNISKLFHRQKTADWAKKKLGSESFKKAIALYFDKFNTRDGIDGFSLKKELNAYEHIMKRYLGKDAICYLNLLANVSLAVDAKPKGLLAS